MNEETAMSDIPNLLDIEDLFTGPARRVDSESCLLCGRRLRGPLVLYVHAVEGTVSLLIPVDQPYDDEGADMGDWAVGPECAKTLPAAYVRVAR